MQDERILSVDNITMDYEGDGVVVECDITTIYGDMTAKVVV